MSVTVPSLEIETKTFGLKVTGAAAQALPAKSNLVPSTRPTPAAPDVLRKPRRLRFSMVNITVPPTLA
jgi:hypothetical protein